MVAQIPKVPNPAAAGAKKEVCSVNRFTLHTPFSLHSARSQRGGGLRRTMALAALGRVDAAASALDDASGADPLLFGTAEGDVAAAGGNDAAAREVWGRTLSAFPGVAWLAARLD